MPDLLPRHVELERFAVTSALGLRFYDAAVGEWIGNDLIAEAYPEPVTASPPGSSEAWPAQAAAPGSIRRVRARFTPSGVAAFHSLPGLHEFEYGEDDAARWHDAAAPACFRVEVRDPTGRFLPCTFAAPAPVKGVFELVPMASPPAEAVPAVPLFSAPTRPVPGGFAVLRAHLRRFQDREPAAWTLAEVSSRIPGRTFTARGLADGRGVLALVFPYPEPLKLSLSSPLNNGPQVLAEQRWPLEFRAWHLWDAAPGEFAELDRTLPLLERPSDLVWESDSPLIPFTGAELVFGRELVVPARAPGETRPRELLVTRR